VVRPLFLTSTGSSSGQYGHVVLEISAGETGKGITFGSKVVGGNVPKDFIPAVEKGIRNAAVDGVVA
jgi:elongation factor G